MSAGLDGRQRPRIQPKYSAKTLDGGQNASRVDLKTRIVCTRLEKVFGQPQQGDIPRAAIIRYSRLNGFLRATSLPRVQARPHDSEQNCQI